MNDFVDFLKVKGEKAQKSLSQNFLVNQPMIHKFIDSGLFQEGDKVVEIGPGGGALTAPLLEKGVDLTAIEISPLMVEWITSKFGEKLRLVSDDALKVDFQALYPDSTEVSLISNIPFKITSSLFEHLFSFASLFKKYLVIVQREVGELMLASPGAKNYGILSILVQKYTEPKKLFLIPKGNFAPVPSVDSMALLLNARPEANGLAKEFVAYLKKVFLYVEKRLNTRLKSSDSPPFQINEEPKHSLQMSSTVSS